MDTRLKEEIASEATWALGDGDEGGRTSEGC